MDIYLSVTAEDYPKAARHASRFAFVSYGIGADNTLLRGSLPILAAPSRTVWSFPPPVRDASRWTAQSAVSRAELEPSRRDAASREPYQRDAFSREPYQRDAFSREQYQRDAPPPRRNLLSLTDRDAPPVDNPETLCGYVSRECARRGYAGAALDFEGSVREDLRIFADCLSRRFAETGRRLYVPEAYADASPGPYASPAPGQYAAATDAAATDAAPHRSPDSGSYSNSYSGSGGTSVLLCTALSGGNFEERLREAVERRGGAGIALDVQRLRMDFTLPAPTGEGVPLDADAFRELSEGRPVYFSPDLCARYFTFTQSGAAHFVLFDDADTLNRKLDLGRRYGVRAALLQWPEIADIAGELRLN